MTGPITMGSARFLNIFLGASPAFGGLFFSHDIFLVLRLILVSMLMLLYVLSISILSRREISITTHSRRVIAGPFIIIFAIISIIVITLFFGLFQIDLVPNLALFSIIMILTFKRTVFQDYSSRGIQKAITILVLSVIVLDSIFVSGTANIFYGLTTLLLIIPSVTLARKLYVT
jgi:hypothetical protein